MSTIRDGDLLLRLHEWVSKMMANNHGVLLLGCGICIGLAIHHIGLGNQKSPVQRGSKTTYAYAGFVDHVRQLSPPETQDCSDDASVRVSLGNRLEQLQSMGRGESAKIVKRGARDVLLEGFYRGMPVLYGPCDGTFVDPTFRFVNEQGR